jgi:hypothetical protein
MATGFKSIANLFAPRATVAPMGVQNPGAAAVVPASGTSQTTAPAEPANPLDQFNTLWQTDPNAVAPVDPLAAPLFNTDPAKIAAAAAKLDFAGGLSPELLAKAMSGQDPAAFMAVLNQVAQRAVATSTQLNAATIEQATSANNKRITDALPGRVKAIQLDSLESTNPVLQHPAAQAYRKVVLGQLQMKNPGMTATMMNAEADRILTGFAEAVMAPAQAASAAKASAASEGTDWDTWVEPSV